MANIYLYDIFFLILFTLIVVIFLWIKRSNLKREGIMYLYRTRVGIKLIDYVGTKYKKTLSVLSVLSVISGYLLMISMFYVLYKIINLYLFQPKIVQALKVPPIMPIFPYVPELFKISFLPPFYFSYWIIAIAVIAVFHEFAHGIIARRYDVKVKTTGFGFLGPFLAAFVEPDEKEMEKKPKFQQIAILTAGTFANILLTIFFIFVFIGFLSAAYTPGGTIFDSYATGIVPASMITMIDGIGVNNLSSAGLLEIINKNNIQDKETIGDNKISINITTVSVNQTKFLIPISDLKSQLEKKPDYIMMYDDMPAIRVQLRGAIVQIGEHEIRTRQDLTEVIKNYKPGDKVKIVTKIDAEYIENEIILTEDPNEKGRAMIGIGYNEPRKGSIASSIFSVINLIREPGTAYEPRWNPDLTMFIYNLIWWLILINFSVALVNMLPVAIFDGGRTFMLTIWAITGSEKTGQIAFKIMTYAILALILLSIYGWVVAMYFTGI